MSGQVFLGIDPQNKKETWIELERHVLTVAGSGAGKGSCLIIPNLMAWPHSAVVVDPKGEAAEKTITYRPGGTAAVLDPFEYADIDPKARHAFNPLDLADNADDVMMIADGLVSTVSDRDPFFDNAARTVIAGVIAFLLEKAPDKERHLANLPGLLDDLNNPNDRAQLFTLMDECRDFGGLSRKAAAYMRREGGKSDSIYTTAADHVSWLASPAMQKLLSAESSLDLRDLKRKQMTLYLVLPPRYLVTHGPFLRLFVRCALSVMWEKVGAQQKGTPCLFILDEFAALGRINDIRTAALQQGRSYGLHVWPFVIDWGQLESLYGKDGAQTFASAADAITFFGIGDPDTLDMVSHWCGPMEEQDVAQDWQTAAGRFQASEQRRVNLDAARHAPPLFSEKKRDGRTSGVGVMMNALIALGNQPVAADQKLQADLDMIRSRIGKPRYPAGLLKDMLSAAAGDVSQQLLVFFNRGGYRFIRPAPYFRYTSAKQFLPKTKTGLLSRIKHPPSIGPVKLIALTFFWWLACSIIWKSITVAETGMLIPSAIVPAVLMERYFRPTLLRLFQQPPQNNQSKPFLSEAIKVLSWVALIIGLLIFLGMWLG